MTRVNRFGHVSKAGALGKVEVRGTQANRRPWKKTPSKLSKPHSSSSLLLPPSSFFQLRSLEKGEKLKQGTGVDMVSKDTKGRNGSAYAYQSVPPKKTRDTKHPLQLLKEARKEGMERGTEGILRGKHNGH